MAEYSVRPTAQNRRHPTAVLTQLWTPHRINATCHWVQTSFEDAVLYGVRSEAKLEQLAPCDYAMLAFGKSPCARTRSWNS
jgi:hypothetical protein